MIKLIRFLITGSFHEHKWEIHDEIDSVTEWGSGDKQHFRTTILKCEICGIIKRKKYRL